MRFRIGTSGWNYPHWKEEFYPKDLSSKGWLEFYSKKFDTVEVNNTFYRWPEAKTLRNWYYLVPDKFIFTIKAPRTITHIRRLIGVGDHLKTFYELTDNLKEKLGCLLFQLPPSFMYNQENFSRVENFLKQLDMAKYNVIEFRHKTWWRDEVYQLFKKHKVIFCTVSGLGMPEELVVTHRVVYLRFHGARYSSRYSSKNLLGYAKQIRELKKSVFAYFDNDARAYAVDNAQELRALLK
jgi:uncharacterized protein YecE (DUF72 family)